MQENDMNIGEQINNTCKHGKSYMKPVESINICPNGMEYVKRLVESGEMGAIQCEPCIIEWLCGDPIETCMNPEEKVQWYTQCTRPIDFWVEHIEDVLNKPQWVANMGKNMWALEVVRSIWDQIETLDIAVQLVAPGI